MKKEKIVLHLSHRIAIVLGLAQVALLVLLVAAWVSFAQGSLHLGWPVVASILFAAQGLTLYYWVYRPYHNIEKVLMLFARGFTLEAMLEQKVLPTPAVAASVRRLNEIVNTQQLIGAGRRQAQYLALQNQINPHFLYNTLEGIRSDALVAGLDNVAQMTEALSTFFRYTISNLEHLVPLEEELTNVENYFLIQKYRFGDRLALEVFFDSNEDRRLLLQGRVPKLSLQPIVENAIVHGVEGKIGQSTIAIKVRGTAQRIIITVSDDGKGMDKETLDKLSHKLSGVYYNFVQPEGEHRGGIALLNVNNRIRLLFGEAYGLQVYSTKGLGTDVEMTLPLQGKDSALPLAEGKQP